MYIIMWNVDANIFYIRKLYHDCIKFCRKIFINFIFQNFCNISYTQCLKGLMFAYTIIQSYYRIIKKKRVLKKLRFHIPLCIRPARL